jgi:hypothetical protein
MRKTDAARWAVLAVGLTQTASVVAAVAPGEISRRLQGRSRRECLG